MDYHHRLALPPSYIGTMFEPVPQNAITMVSISLSMVCTMPTRSQLLHQPYRAGLEIICALGLVLLGILSWRSRIAGVGVGFVLSLSFNIVQAFFRGNAPPEMAKAASNLGQLSFPVGGHGFVLVVMDLCWRFRDTEPANPICQAVNRS
jgi:hypothetical protein